MKFPFLLVAIATSVIFCADTPDFFNTDSGPVKTTPIYQASLMIEGRGKIIYIDPSSKGSFKGLPKADLILITSDKPDHYDPEAIARVSRKTTAALAPEAIASKIQHCTGVSNGETVQFGDVSISAVPAYHVGGTDKGKANGYVLTFPGLRVYVSGDTGAVPEMKAIKNLDVAFLAVGSPNTMPLEEAAGAIKLLKPKSLYPYNFAKTSLDDIRKQLATPGTEIRIREWY